MGRGFTLVELLIVIALIAIIAAILFPVFARAREKALQASCSSNLKQLAIGMLMYATDSDQTFPMGTPHCVAMGDDSRVQWWVAIDPYTRNGQLLSCPTAVREDVSNATCPTPALGPTFGCGGRVPGQTGLSYGYSIAIASNMHENGSAFCCGSLGGHEFALKAPAESILLADSARANIGGGLWPGGGPCAGSFRDGICAPITFANHMSGCAHGVCGFRGTYSARLQSLGAGTDDIARHNGGANIAFADGHVKWFKNEQIKGKSVGGPIRFNGYELFGLP